MSALAQNSNSPHQRLTIRGAYQKYYSEWSPDLSAASENRHGFDLLRWEKYMGDIPVQDLTTEHYQRFRALTTKSGLSAATCETTLQTIRQVVRVCHAFRVIRVVPDRGKPRRKPAPQPRNLTIDEVSRLYAACDNRKWPKVHVPASIWWKCVLAVGLWTCLRRQDLFWELSWEHVHEDHIDYSAGKTGKRHIIPLHPCVITHLEAMRAPLDNATGSIFNTPKNLRDLRHRLRFLSEEANVTPWITSKALRSTGISWWRNSDSDAGAIMHGVGIPRVLYHYLDQSRVLEHAMHDVELPEAMLAFGKREQEKQLSLW